MKRVPHLDLPPRIGVVTALPLETAAVLAVLGDPPRYDVPGAGAVSGRSYWRCALKSPRGGVHSLVVAQADQGNNSAAIRGNQLLTHFPTVDSLIMCGIAGGLPHPERVVDHVRLGDVVVSNWKGVVQYDFTTRLKSPRRRSRTDLLGVVNESPRPPSAWLLEAVRLLEAERLSGRHPWEQRIDDGLARRGQSRPADETDRLHDPADPAQARPHPLDPDRRPGQPRIFFGAIASSNTLLKDPEIRDALRDAYQARAVEMEGSGVADASWSAGVGYLVVRGVCDYCDAHKNKDWQAYAAMAAAGYVRALLESMPGVELETLTTGAATAGP